MGRRVVNQASRELVRTYYSAIPSTPSTIDRLLPLRLQSRSFTEAFLLSRMYDRGVDKLV